MAVVTACGGGGDNGGTGPNQQPDNVTQSVGAAGGTVVTPSGAAGVVIPAGTFTQPVMVTVTKLDTSPTPGTGPLPTNLKQYGPYYDFTTSPQVAQFGDSARVGVCQVTDPSSPLYPPEPHDRLRLAHTVNGQLELLDRVDVTDFLRCNNVSASTATGGLSKIVSNIANFFRAKPLYAAHGGLGGKVKSFSPFGAVQMTDDALHFLRVSAGDRTSCGIVGVGKAYCWGNNSQGQLGNGSTSGSNTPVAVTTPQTFLAISVTGMHVCALNNSQAGWCWGQNNYGQVGDSTTTNVLTPFGVFGTAGFATGVSSDHTCALDAATLRAFCWGRNSYGELGVGSVDEDPHLRPRPVVIGGGSPTSWSNLSVGLRHTCGTSGTFIFCWGDNNDGKLGDGTAISRSVPTKIQSNLTFVSVSAGDLFTCALTADGSAYCWGQNFRGELGTGGTVQNQFTPVPVAGGLTFKQISSGGGHTCGVTSNTAEMYCWGPNASGQLGDLTNIERTAPVLVAGGILWESVSAGSDHTCGRSTSTIVYCWGNNSAGQLGDGTSVNHNIPIRVVGQ
ncbi:MAG: RCC1 domain-containing protein [Gemmatimonadaceae bacterium]